MCNLLVASFPTQFPERYIYIIRVEGFSQVSWVSHVTNIVIYRFKQILEYHTIRTGIALIDGGVDELANSVSSKSNQYLGARCLYRTQITSHREGKTCTHAYDGCP